MLLGGLCSAEGSGAALAYIIAIGGPFIAIGLFQINRSNQFNSAKAVVNRVSQENDLPRYEEIEDTRA